MFKSELISKYYVKGFDNKWTGEIEYTYKYRGYEYTVYVNTDKGNEPLSSISFTYKNIIAKIFKKVKILLDKVESI